MVLDLQHYEGNVLYLEADRKPICAYAIPKMRWPDVGAAWVGVTFFADARDAAPTTMPPWATVHVARIKNRYYTSLARSLSPKLATNTSSTDNSRLFKKARFSHCNTIQQKLQFWNLGFIFITNSILDFHLLKL